jgi:hypothetical protein
LDCSGAINACIVACPVVELQCATYYVQNTVYQSTAGRIVQGAQVLFPGGNAIGSSIIMTNGTKTIYQIGPNTYTGSNTQSNNGLKYVNIGRSVAPVISSNCYGLSIQYTVWADIERVFVFDNMQGIVMTGTAQTRLNFVGSDRYNAGTGGGTDTFIAFNINGNVNVGFSGGNASLYMTRCVSGSSSASTSSIGLSLAGTYGWSDVYVDQLETSDLMTAVSITGNGNTSATIDNQNDDVQFRNCILDQCLNTAYSITNLSNYGAIEIVGGYCAPTTGTSTFLGCVFISNCKGSISISETQMLMGYAPLARAVYVSGSDGVMMKNNVAYECGCTGGAYQLANITDCIFEDQIRNLSAAGAASAVQITGTCQQNYFKMSISGKAAAWTVGYNLPSTCTKSEFNCTNVNQGCLSISPGKLDYNAGTIITTVGTFGTGNYASGVMT